MAKQLILPFWMNTHRRFFYFNAFHLLRTISKSQSLNWVYVLCVTLLFVYLSHRIVDIVVRLLPVKWPTNASQNQRQFQIEPILTSRVERHNSLIICTSTIDAQNWHSIIFSLYCIERVVFWFDHIITRYTITEITIYDYLLIYFYFSVFARSIRLRFCKPIRIVWVVVYILCYLVLGNAFAFFSGLSLGIRRKRCNKLLQLSESNCVTLAVELRE